MKKVIGSAEEMQSLGVQLGKAMKGGEVIELIGDVGAGKTTLVKGIATGLGVDEDIQSPSFTLARHYQARDNLALHHYDFYRLNDPGVVAHELVESVGDSSVVTIIEWAETVEFALPEDRAVIRILYRADEHQRDLELKLPLTQQHLSGVVG